MISTIFVMARKIDENLPAVDQLRDRGKQKRMRVTRRSIRIDHNRVR